MAPGEGAGASSRVRALLAGPGWRLVAGCVVTLAVAKGLQMLSVSWLRQGRDLHLLVREGGPLEWLQVAVVAATAGLLLWRGAATVTRLFGLLMLAVLVRELDNELTHALLPEAHWPMVALVLAAAARLAWVHREGLFAGVSAFTRSPALAPALFGLVLVLGYAQEFGQREVWFALAGPRNSAAKRFVEEGLELLGHLWLLLAAVEARLSDS